jgi:hypothetical protein
MFDSTDCFHFWWWHDLTNPKARKTARRKLAVPSHHSTSEELLARTGMLSYLGLFLSFDYLWLFLYILCTCS